MTADGRLKTWEADQQPLSWMHEMKPRTLISVIAIAVVAALTIPAGLAAQDAAPQARTPLHHHYKLIDMGTLGGPASYLTEPGFGFGELDLNGRGEVAGKSDTSTPNNGSGNCPPICFDTKVFRWRKGVLTPLDGLSTVIDNSDVGTINARGWISGNSATGDIDPLTGGQIVHAVLWKDDETTDLGTLGGLWSSGTYVTDGGAVVGISTINKIPDPYSFLGASIHTFIWRNGAMQDLDISLSEPTADSIRATGLSGMKPTFWETYSAALNGGISNTHLILLLSAIRRNA